MAERDRRSRVPRRERRRRPLARSALVAVAAALVVTALAGAALGVGAFALFRQQTLDRLFPTGALDPRVVVVGIDQPSERALGSAWPWPRREQARLLEAILGKHPRLVVDDVLLDRADPADDPALAGALGRGPVLLSAAAGLVADPSASMYVAASLTGPTPALARAAAGVGLTNVAVGEDGVVRTLPLVAQLPSGSLRPSVVLEAYAAVRGDPATPIVRPHGVQVGSDLVPTEGRATLRIAFPPGLGAGGSEAGYLSARDVLAGGGGSLRGAIVLVGVTDPAGGDVHRTPLGPSTPGVVILAGALNTMLTRGFVALPSTWSTLLVVLVVALLAAMLGQVAPPWIALAGAVVMAAGYLLASLAAFDLGRPTDLVVPELALALAVVLSLGARAVLEIRGRRRAGALFAQYVPPLVARRLIEEPRLVEAAIRGERFEATLLFCDLRGFTALAGAMEPQQVRDMLEVFYDRTSQIVLEHDGTLIQYVGDEVYAAFGVPVPTPDHAAKAVACAMAFQRAGPEIDRRLAELGTPGVRYGIGIESGSVVAAIVGNELRRQYTVNGDVVNVAARLCAAAPPGEVWISSDVLRRLTPQPTVEDLGIRPFKNVAREVHVFRLKLEDREGLPPPTSLP